VNCSKCNNSMALLFTSFYCPHCENEGKNKNESKKYPYLWYFASIFTIEDCLYMNAKLFESTEKLKEYYNAHYTGFLQRKPLYIIEAYSTQKLEPYTMTNKQYYVVKEHPVQGEIAPVRVVE